MANFSRRQFLISAAALPLAAIIPTQALAASSVIHALQGIVTINKKPLTRATSINNGDEITVALGGNLVFSIGEDAFLVRGGSTLQAYAEEKSVLVSALRLVNGGARRFWKAKNTHAHLYGNRNNWY